MLGRLSVDKVTIAGVALVLMPLLTMAHEIGGHAAMCLATGGKLTALGAFYVNCDTDSAMAQRLVALAGVGADALLGAIAFVVWRKLLKGDLERLIGWYVWLCLCFSAAGYFLFSGISGVGDLGPDVDGGIGPLPYPLVWRAGFTALGLLAYFHLVKTGTITLNSMIGQGGESRAARRTIAHGFYAVLCFAAVLASLPNPVGVFITLASATAASFGGKAGLISIGYATRGNGEARSFEVDRNWAVFALGLMVSVVFAAVLGPTIRFG